MRHLIPLCALLTVSSPLMNAGTFTGLSGNLDIMLAGQTVVFAPTGSPNLTIVGPFETATVGVPFPAQLTMLDLASGPVTFDHGTYVLGLSVDPVTPSLGQVTPTSPTTFNSFFDVFFDVTFNFVGPGSGDSSGDVLGEFGGLPGISGCVNGAVSTCDSNLGLSVTGSFDVAGSGLRGVSITSTPEPATLALSGLAILLLALRRRR